MNHNLHQALFLSCCENCSAWRREERRLEEDVDSFEWLRILFVVISLVLQLLFKFAAFSSHTSQHDATN